MNSGNRHALISNCLMGGKAAGWSLLAAGGSFCSGTSADRNHNAGFLISAYQCLTNEFQKRLAGSGCSSSCSPLRQLQCKDFMMIKRRIMHSIHRGGDAKRTPARVRSAPRPSPRLRGSGDSIAGVTQRPRCGRISAAGRRCWCGDPPPSTVPAPNAHPCGASPRSSRHPARQR